MKGPSGGPPSNRGRPSGPTGTWRTVLVVTVFTVLVTWWVKWVVGGLSSLRLGHSPGLSLLSEQRVAREAGTCAHTADMVMAVVARPSHAPPGPGHTLVSVRRVVPSSDVTMDTWEVGVPGSSSTVTVSSSTSGASGIVASEAWLPGLCSWRGDRPTAHLAWGAVLGRVPPSLPQSPATQGPFQLQLVRAAACSCLNTKGLTSPREPQELAPTLAPSSAALGSP